MSLADIDVTILCGGRGTRMQEVLGNTPKFLAPVMNCPFCSYLLDQLYCAGARRIILATGWAHEQILDYIATLQQYAGLHIRLIQDKPLNCGIDSVLAKIYDVIEKEAILVMNGDTLVDSSLINFVNFLRQQHSFMYPGILMKNGVSTGVHLLPRQYARLIAAGVDGFPPSFSLQFQARDFIDIGTPEAYESVRKAGFPWLNQRT